METDLILDSSSYSPIVLVPGDDIVAQCIYKGLDAVRGKGKQANTNQQWVFNDFSDCKLLYVSDYSTDIMVFSAKETASQTSCILKRWNNKIENVHSLLLHELKVIKKLKESQLDHHLPQLHGLFFTQHYMFQVWEYSSGISLYSLNENLNEMNKASLEPSTLLYQKLKKVVKEIFYCGILPSNLSINHILWDSSNIKIKLISLYQSNFFICKHKTDENEFESFFQSIVDNLIKELENIVEDNNEE